MRMYEISNETGFALVATILVIVMLGALGLFGVALAHNERVSFSRNSSLATAFYAAETGLNRGLQNWGPSGAAAMGPGDTVVVDSGMLAGGASYRVEATRLDDGSAVQPLFAMESVGTAQDGRAQRVGLLSTSADIDHPIQSAVRVRGALKITGNAEVSGVDQVPPNQGGVCPDPGASAPGIVTTDADNTDISGSATVDGDPPVLEDADTTGFFNFGDMSYEEMAAAASITLADGAHVSSDDPSPSLTADGSCDTSDPYNWGDPENAGQPCSGYFPVIHAAGNLKLSGQGAGQGILLVDGDLDLSGGVEFYGPVVVKGKVKSTGTGFHFHGGLVAGATDIKDETLISGNTQVGYSSCAIERALAHSPAAAALALTDRAWYQSR